jgi:hypothetical protein
VSRIFALLALTLAACGAPPPDRMPAPPAVATLALGTGDASGFVAFSNQQDVTLVEGAQGGFHVWVRYQYDGVPGGSAHLARSAHRVGDGAIVLRTSAVATVESESMPLPMFMCPSPVGLSVID